MHACKIHFQTQEVGGTLIGEDGLVVMAGAELVEWYQTHVFYVPFTPFQLLQIVLPSAASTAFRCTSFTIRRNVCIHSMESHCGVIQFVQH